MWNKWREKQISWTAALLLCGMTATTSIGCTYAWQHWNNSAAQQKLREIDALTSKRYVGEMDQEQIADLAAIGYVSGLGDRWSSYITAEEYAEYRRQDMGQTSGIGVSIVTGTDSIRVSDVYPNSPAASAGMEKGDWIVGAEGLTIEADGTNAVIEAVRGEEGTEVTISFCKDPTGGASNATPPVGHTASTNNSDNAGDTSDTNGTNDIGEVKTVTMTRAIVEQNMAWGKMLDNAIGYIRINNFHVGSAAQFQSALETLSADGATGFVIDVRHNGGGRVKEMSSMLDLLLPEGTIITLRTKTGVETVYTSDAAQMEQPIVVLVDDRSISAAEFFGAALQEYGRAVLVGTHTTGKGRAQQTFPLSDGSALNLSVEEYFTPHDQNLADVGIAPDVEVTLTEDQQANFYFLSPQEDPQIQAALAQLPAQMSD